MEHSQILASEAVVPAEGISTGVARRRVAGWARQRVLSVGFSLLDQAFCAGGMFLANVVLARSQSKEEYGLFALSYSAYTFLQGVHNAAILEPYTVYGSGKYYNRFGEYFRLMLRSNLLACAGLTALLGGALMGMRWAAPQLLSRSMLGLLLTAGILLTASFVRRTCYTLRQPQRAAAISVWFLAVICGGLLLTLRLHRLNGFSVFTILAAGWIAGVLMGGRSVVFGSATGDFVNSHPGYWREHWNYARWVVATSLIFQLTTQGYYWLVAGALSVKEVAELRAMHFLVLPADQVLVALSFLVLPKLSSHCAGERRSQFLGLWKRYELFTAIITVSLLATIWMVGRHLVHWLYGGKFDDAVGVLYLLAMVPVVMGIGNCMNDALKSMEKPNLVFRAYAASGTVTVVVGILLVRHFGLRGAAIGMLCSAAAYTAVLTAGFMSAFSHRAPEAGERVGQPRES